MIDSHSNDVPFGSTAAIPALTAISDDFVVVSYAKEALKEIIGN
jgi:hypothetical protein